MVPIQTRCIAAFVAVVTADNVIGQSLPSGSARPLKRYGADLQETLLTSEMPMPKWLAACDPPYYETFRVNIRNGSPIRIVVFAGGSPREETTDFIPVPDNVQACSGIKPSGAMRVRKPTRMPASASVDTFPIVNAKRQLVYLLEERRFPTSDGAAGKIVVKRTLFSVSDKAISPVGNGVEAIGASNADIETLIPFASLLP